MPTRKTSTTPKNQIGLLAGLDTEIASAKHDDIMLWVDKNLRTVLAKGMPAYFGTHWATRSGNVYKGIKGVFQDSYFETPVTLPYDLEVPRPAFEILDKIWEYPIKDSKGGLVGFADLFVEAVVYTMDRFGDFHAENYGASGQSERILIEVKTTIQLGALLRQINLYKMHKGLPMLVVSPDTRFVDTLREQGVYFVEYTG